VPPTWPATLKQEWQVTVGEGYSSPVVVGSRVFVFARQQDNEVVRCVDLTSGNQIWCAEPYGAPFKPGPAAPGDKQTRSTPAVAQGRVFTLGASGVLSCLDARTGALLWRRDTSPCPAYGASASPLIADGLCIVHVGIGREGGLTAFDAATGKEQWCNNTDSIGPAYASPILVDLAGERQVVTLTQGNFLAVSAANGKRLWSVGLPRFDLEKCITPIRYRDLILFADHGEPLRALRLDRGDTGLTPREIWRAKGPTLHMSSPVLVGSRVLGFSGLKSGHLFCLEAATGKLLWESEGRLGSYAALVNAGSVWLALTDRGQLLVLRPSGTACEVVARYLVSDTPTWAHPVFLGKRILIKDQTTLRSFAIGGGCQQKVTFP
jgi:outer membrane protein assembly factor BamB